MGSEQLFDNFLLGVTASAVELNTRQENLAATSRLCECAQHSIKILSRALDPYIYDDERVINAITQFSRPNPQVQVKILLFDSDSLLQQRHRLILLAQRISSKIVIRILGKDTSWQNESLLLADRHGYLINPQSDRYEGEVDFNNSNRNQELDQKFTHYWDHSDTELPLRRLTL